MQQNTYSPNTGALGYPPTSYPDQQLPAQPYPSQLNQPLIPGGYLLQPAIPTYEQVINDPLFKLEQSTKCSRITIMVFSMITYVLFFGLFLVGLTNALDGQQLTYYAMILLFPHLFLALVAHSTVRKPMREQLMNAGSSTCSLIGLVFFTLVPLGAIFVCISLNFGRDCHSDSCGLYFAAYYYFGIIPALVFIPLWFLPLAYVIYKSKLEGARRNQAFMQSVLGQHQAAEQAIQA